MRDPERHRSAIAALAARQWGVVARGAAPRCGTCSRTHDRRPSPQRTPAPLAPRRVRRRQARLDARATGSRGAGRGPPGAVAESPRLRARPASSLRPANHGAWTSTTTREPADGRGSASTERVPSMPRTSRPSSGIPVTTVARTLRRPRRQSMPRDHPRRRSGGGAALESRRGRAVEAATGTHAGRTPAGPQGTEGGDRGARGARALRAPRLAPRGCLSATTCATGLPSRRSTPTWRASEWTPSGRTTASRREARTAGPATTTATPSSATASRGTRGSTGPAGASCASTTTARLGPSRAPSPAVDRATLRGLGLPLAV